MYKVWLHMCIAIVFLTESLFGDVFIAVAQLPADLFLASINFFLQFHIIIVIRV